MPKARFQGKEYVMAMLGDRALSDGEALRLLEAEYKVLCQCNGFKSWFDEFARQSNVAVPGLFYPLDLPI